MFGIVMTVEHAVEQNQQRYAAPSQQEIGKANGATATQGS